MNEPIIQLSAICKTYFTGKVPFVALKEINLSINRGEYIAILGPSGSGKSTLMQIIGCLSTPTSGNYLLDGNEVSGLSDNELAKVRNLKIGFIFQKFNLLPQLSIVENVALPLVYRGVGRAQRNALARQILAQLGLEKHFDHRANELSGGQQQRVAISRALVTNPDIILADEPTGNLDSKAGADVTELLKSFSQQQKTIIAVTHDLQFAKNASRMVYIYDGQIKTETDSVENHRA